jgi:hypothetical protein
MRFLYFSRRWTPDLFRKEIPIVGSDHDLWNCGLLRVTWSMEGLSGGNAATDGNRLCRLLHRCVTLRRIIFTVLKSTDRMLGHALPYIPTTYCTYMDIKQCTYEYTFGLSALLCTSANVYTWMYFVVPVICVLMHQQNNLKCHVCHLSGRYLSSYRDTKYRWTLIGFIRDNIGSW